MITIYDIFFKTKCTYFNKQFKLRTNQWLIDGYQINIIGLCCNLHINSLTFLSVVEISLQT